MNARERPPGAPDRLWWGVLCGAAGSLITTLAFVAFLAFGGVLQLETPRISLFDSGPRRVKAPLAVAGAPLFTLAGSNTIGSDLGPRLVAAFLSTRGYHDLTIGRRAGSARATDIVVRGVDRTGSTRYVELLADGSKTAPPALAEGRADIGMMSSRMDDAQAQLLAARFGGDPRAGGEHIIALDGVAVLVNHGSTVAALDRAALARIFSGEARDWRDVGRGKPGPIAVMRRDDDSGTYDTFDNLVMKPAGVAVSTTAAPYGDSDELIGAVGANPDAIGFAGMGFASHDVKRLAVADRVGAPALPPSAVWVKLETYALSRRLYLYAPPGVAGEAADFVAFALSEAAATPVRAAGFVDLGVQVVPGDEARAVARGLTSATPGAAAYLARIAGADRLSADLHFSGSRLDSRALRDVSRVAALMSARRLGGNRLVLVGFSDFGEAAADVETARAALAAAGATVGAAQTLALGAAPITAATTAQAHERNRRVELWLRR